jgi:hypothetical protein
MRYVLAHPRFRAVGACIGALACSGSSGGSANAIYDAGPELDGAGVGADFQPNKQDGGLDRNAIADGGGEVSNPSNCPASTPWVCQLHDPSVGYDGKWCSARDESLTQDDRCWTSDPMAYCTCQLGTQAQSPSDCPADVLSVCTQTGCPSGPIVCCGEHAPLVPSAGESYLMCTYGPRDAGRD